MAADLLVVCDYGQILAPAVLAAARHGGVNLHASLLPKYRGAAPIQWAVYHGEVETGVTVIHMTPELDAGPCIAQRSTAIGPEETAAELEVRLSHLGARLVCETIDRLETGEFRPLPQDPSLATRAPRLKKTDGAIDWTRPAEAIRNQIRAMEPWPKTYTFWRREAGAAGPFDSRPGRRRGMRGRRFRRGGANNAPGTILKASDGQLLVAAGSGALAIAAVQPSGKRMLPIGEFLRRLSLAGWRPIGDRGVRLRFRDEPLREPIDVMHAAGAAVEPDDSLIGVHLLPKNAALVDVEPHAAGALALDQLRFGFRIGDGREDIGGDADDGHARLDFFERELLKSPGFF